MRNQPSGMGTKDGSNQKETADCDREADILPGMAAGLLPRLKFTSAGWRNGNRRRRWFTRGGCPRWCRFSRGMPSLLTVQYADDFGDLVLLKEANCGHACGARMEAGA